MKKFGLIGEKLSHSFSPKIHSLLGDYEYKLYEMPAENIESFLKHTDTAGLNVTIPYKKEVIKYCSGLSPTAQKLMSVNTLIKKPDGTFFGDNTDYYGFTYMISKSSIRIAGKKVLVLGDGGAAATVKAVVTDQNAGEMVVISRKGENNYENISRHYDGEIIINATSVGMYPNNGSSVIDIKDFPQCKCVFDLIYNPAKTKLILDAEELGIPSFNGLSMLVAQAKKSSELFTGISIDDHVIGKITDEISKRTKSIILIGMPGCGKTTIGASLAKITGRVFIDIDAEIVKYAEKDIPDIFKNDGEEKFRAIETEMLEKYTKLSGAVIAAGGGAVTKERNRDLIRQNSTVIFIERDIGLLATKGRPLSYNRDLLILYNSRIKAYNEWSDHIVENKTTDDTVEEIKELLAL
ncbi:MAG: shikimate kinase [Clostridia bacterium]